MKKNRLLLTIIILVAITIIIRVMFFGKKEQTAGPQGKSGQGAARLSGIVVKETSLSNVVAASGTLLANEEVTLRPEISGKITRLNIKEGGKVRKGELLVKINDVDLLAEQRKLQSQFKLMSEKAERQKKLFEMNGISRQEYDEMLNMVNSLQADMDFNNAQIAKTEIRAPFDGQIGLKNVSEGSYVTSENIIASIQQLDPLKLDFSVPEKYAGFIRIGDSVKFVVEGIRDTFPAAIFAIEPKIDQATRTVKLRARTDNKQGRLFPGAFARIELNLGNKTDAMMIPAQAVIPVLKGKKVFISRDGIALSQPIETGVRTENKVEVMRGLSTGDTVITTGIMQLRDSMKVNIVVTDL
jgi:membrane fusion protein, multidrug efflux system